MIEFKEFEESWGSRGGFDITPMLDMIFILLIFFLLTAGVTRPVVPVDLPESAAAENPEDQSAVVSINEKMELFLNGDPVGFDQLETQLSTLYSGSLEQSVFIEADESVDFGFVVRVMDLCKKSGAPGVSFLVEQGEASD